MNNKKDSNYFFTIKSFILICISISIGTNLILFLIYFLSDHHYKYFGIIIHSLLILLGIINICYLFSNEQKNSYLKKYKSSIFFFSSFIYISFILYLILIIYMYIYKYDIDIFYFYAICVLLWGLFHLSLILIIKSYIGETSKRKGLYEKKKNEKYSGL